MKGKWKTIFLGAILLVATGTWMANSAILSRVKTWSSAETLTASDLNAEFDNILNNLDPDNIEDASTNATAMQATADPYPGASESLATDLRGELQRIRYLLKQINGETYWYIDPDNSLLSTSTPNYAGLGINEADNDEMLHMTSSVTWKPIAMLENTNADAAGHGIQFYKNSASPADNDYLGRLAFRGNNSGDTETIFATIQALSSDVTAGDEAGHLYFGVKIDSGELPFLELAGYGGTVSQGHIVLNSTGADIDTTIEATGVADALIIQGSDGQVTLGALGSGDVQSDASGVLSVTSDARQKDIQRYITASLEDIAKLQGVVFKWKDGIGQDTTQEYIGFTAQNVDEVFPALVGKVVVNKLDKQEREIKDAKGNIVRKELIREASTEVVPAEYWSLNRVGLIPYLVEALKEAKDRIETLEAKVAVLEGG